MNRKINFPYWFLIILLAAFAVGYFAWTESLNDESGIMNYGPSTPLALRSGDKLSPELVEGWKTYRNEEHGFEVKYPATMQFKSNKPTYILNERGESPLNGVKIGPLTLIVVSNDTFKNRAREYLEDYFEIAENPSKGVDEEGIGGISCKIIDISNSLAKRGVYCGGSGGTAFYALILGAKADIFVDGYDFDHSQYLRTINLESVGRVQQFDEQKFLADVNQILSTFKFIQ